MDHAFRKSTLQVDNVVLASVEPEACSVRAACRGRARAPSGSATAKQVRNLRAAVTEGANAGLTLDDGLMLNANRALVSRLPAEFQAGQVPRT